MNYKRLIISIILGAILGVFCILGVSQRLPAIPLPNSAIYLTNAWYNRVIMGIIIGLAGEIVIIKDSENLVNATIRGGIIGAIVSVSFAFLGQETTITYFFAGIMFGIINDLISTLIMNKSKKSKQVNKQ